MTDSSGIHYVLIYIRFSESEDIIIMLSLNVWLRVGVARLKPVCLRGRRYQDNLLRGVYVLFSVVIFVSLTHCIPEIAQNGNGQLKG